MSWEKLLVWATGQIDEALRQKLEFVRQENRVYRALSDRHSPHWRLQDAERKALSEKGKPLGVLSKNSNEAQTIGKWLVAIEPQGRVANKLLAGKAAEENSRR